MYLDTLDTVRFNTNYYEDTTYSQALAKASIASNLLLKNRIVLSQSQIFDSSIVLDALGDRGFCRLIESNYILASLYNVKKNVSFSDHLLNYLELRCDYIFSCVSVDSEVQKYYKENIIAILNGTPGRDVCCDERLISFKNMVEFFSCLERSRNYRYIIATNGNKKLSDYILNAKESSNLEIDFHVNVLKKIITKNGTPINDRAYIYDMLRNFNIDQQKARAIVDIAYNSAVYDSVVGMDSKCKITVSGKIFNDEEWVAVKNVFSSIHKQNYRTDVEYYANEEDISVSWNEIWEFLDYLKHNELAKNYSEFIHHCVSSSTVLATVIISGVLAFALKSALVKKENLSFLVEVIPFSDLMTKILDGALEKYKDKHKKLLKKIKTETKIKKIIEMKGF